MAQIPNGEGAVCKTVDVCRGGFDSHLGLQLNNNVTTLEDFKKRARYDLKEIARAAREDYDWKEDHNFDEDDFPIETKGSPCDGTKLKDIWSLKSIYKAIDDAKTFSNLYHLYAQLELLHWDDIASIFEGVLDRDVEEKFIGQAQNVHETEDNEFDGGFDQTFVQLVDEYLKDQKEFVRDEIDILNI